MTFHIVQPYDDGPDRLHKATVVSSHRTAADAFVELDRVAARLHGFEIPGDALELLVVDQQRPLVRRGTDL